MKPELLAPAGQWDSMVAAVQNGADAVYFGGKAFNARASAANFDDEELLRALDYCHDRSVKAYITFNTLLFDKELQQALEYASFLYSAGADAVIVQDIGLAALLREQLPGLVLHASTQMGIHNLEGVQLAKELGFKRVVLSRELSIEHIAIIKASCDMPVEVFVHGAMCVSFSGGCLFSSMVGGRSGNRGACAQPCRLPYTLGKENGYLLSMKDMCMLEHLDELKKAGVDSLKLEGRMKRPEYVAVVTRAYRKALDGEADVQAEMKELLKIFNRGGFSTGYYFGGKLTAPERPNHWGQPVGKVERTEGEFAVVKLREPLHTGDGVEFVGKQSHGGLAVKREFIGSARLFAPDAKAGDILMRTTDAMQLAVARKSYSEENRFSPVSGRLILQAGETAKFTLTDDLGHTAEVAGGLVQTAQRQADSARIKEQISKLGGTTFKMESIEITANGFLPVSELNALRREAVQKLIALRRVRHEKALVYLKRLPLKAPNDQSGVCVQVSSLEQAIAAFEAGADEVQFAPADYGAGLDKDLASLQNWRSEGKKLLLSLPPVALGGDMRVLENAIQRQKVLIDGAVAGSISQLQLIRYTGIKVADVVPGALNSYAVQALLDLGFDRVCLSGELTKPQIRDIIAAHPASELNVHGRAILMYLKNCPKKACGKECPAGKGFLKDRAGYEFPLSKVTMDTCLLRVLNSAVTDILPKIDQVPKPAMFRLQFILEPASVVTERVTAMISVLKGEKVSSYPEATGGHWNRGLIQ